MLAFSENYALTVDGREVSVYHTEAADYAVLCFTGEKDISIQVQKPFSTVSVRPLRTGHRPTLEDSTIRLRLKHSDRVSVEPYGLKNPLFLLCSERIDKPVNATHVFARGTVTDIGSMELHSGDCIYLEEGAVVAGGFWADRAKDICITGNGIMNGLPLQGAGKKKIKMMKFIECENVSISGVTIVNSPSWNVVPIACKNVIIDGINIIGIVMSSDGIDIVGCEDVEVMRCFICVNDDCLVVKANRYDDPRGCKDAKRIRMHDCVLWKLKCGNAIEIGYETSAEEISEVVFENLDVIHSELEGWQSGGVFTIHNGDRAHVHDILYRDIYIEDAQEKLIDFKILTSKYSVDKWRGKISDIILDGIYVIGDILPPSIIRGYESDLGEPELIENIQIRNLTLNGKPVQGQLNAHAVVELARSVRFE